MKTGEQDLPAASSRPTTTARTWRARPPTTVTLKKSKPPTCRWSMRPSVESRWHRRRAAPKALRADIKKNLEREVKFRVQARNKSP